MSACLMGSLLLSACYSAAPLGPAGPQPGTRIHAELTREGSAELAPRIGSGVVAVEGIATQVRPEAWEIALIRTEQTAGTDVLWNREVVSFPATSLSRVSERRFERGRSYLTAGLLTAAVVVLGRVFANNVFGGSGGNDDGGTPPPQ